jgi:thiol-disulfide isomerase/thioredoxin
MIRKYLRNIFRWLLAAIGIYLFEFATGWIRAIDDYGIDILVMPVKYFLLVVYLIYKKKITITQALLLFTLTIASIPFVAMIVDDVPPSAINAYINNGMGILGVWSACSVMSKVKPGIKWIIPGLTILISIWYLMGGRQNYFNLLNGDTFSGKVKPTNVDLSWKVYNKNNDTFTSNDYNNKIVYMDFWTTSCGICFRKFPDLEKLYQKYKSHSNVMIQVINIPIQRDTAGMAFYMIERSGTYTFPVLIGADSMAKTFGVVFYPTVVILKDNKMVFRGRTELAETALEDIIEGKH